MATYYCSPRANWFENMTDEERRQMAACAPNTWADHQVRHVVIGGGTMPTYGLSDSDVERVARRAAELVLEAIRGANDE